MASAPSGRLVCAAVLALLIDLAALAVVAAGVRRGWRSGGVGTAAGMIGLVLGFLIGAWLTTHVVGPRVTTPEYVFLGLVLLIGGALVGHRSGTSLGLRLHSRAHEGPFGLADRAAGAAIDGVVAAGLAGVLLLTLVALAPARWVGSTKSSAAYSVLLPAGRAVESYAGGVVDGAPAELRDAILRSSSPTRHQGSTPSDPIRP